MMRPQQLFYGLIHLLITKTSAIMVHLKDFFARKRGIFPTRGLKFRPYLETWSPCTENYDEQVGDPLATHKHSYQTWNGKSLALHLYMKTLVFCCSVSIVFVLLVTCMLTPYEQNIFLCFFSYVDLPFSSVIVPLSKSDADFIIPQRHNIQQNTSFKPHRQLGRKPTISSVCTPCFAGYSPACHQYRPFAKIEGSVSYTMYCHVYQVIVKAETPLLINEPVGKGHTCLRLASKDLGVAVLAQRVFVHEYILFTFFHQLVAHPVTNEVLTLAWIFQATQTWWGVICAGFLRANHGANQRRYTLTIKTPEKHLQPTKMHISSRNVPKPDFAVLSVGGCGFIFWALGLCWNLARQKVQLRTSGKLVWRKAALTVFGASFASV